MNKKNIIEIDINEFKKQRKNQGLFYSSLLLYVVVLIGVTLYKVSFIYSILIIAAPIVYGYIKYRNYKTSTDAIIIKE